MTISIRRGMASSGPASPGRKTPAAMETKEANTMIRSRSCMKSFQRISNSLPAYAAKNKTGFRRHSGSVPRGTLPQGFLIRGGDFGQAVYGPGVQRGFFPLLSGAAERP